MLMESVLDGLRLLAEDTGGAPAPWDDFWYSPLGRPSSTGMRVTADTAKSIACVYACVSVIGRMVASFPGGIYKYTSDGGKKLAPLHPLYSLIATAPNHRQTPFEFMQMMQGHLELRGNAYAEILSNSRGLVEEVMPLHPDRIVVEQMKTGKLRYRYDDPLKNNQTRYILQEEMFHLRNWSDDGIVGQSTVALGADVFGVAMAAQEYSARFFANDATPRGVLEGAQFKTKADETAFRDSWQMAQTRMNRHKTAVLPIGVTFKEIGIKPSDAQLLDARKFSRIEICSMFGVPPHLVGETEKTATYASVEQFNIMFATQCLWPRVVNWEQTLQRDLLQNDRYFAKYSMASLLRGDTAARYASYQIGLQNGWLCQDDVRVMEDMNPLPNGAGKDYWRPLTWTKLGALSGGTNLQQSTAVPPDAGGAEESGVDPGDQQKEANRVFELRERLRVLAYGNAERCVRKEAAALRKLGAAATQGDLDSFYLEHARFVSEVMHIYLATAVAWCDLQRATPQQREHYVNHSASAVQDLTALAVDEPATKQLIAAAVKGLPQ